ncbi:RNA-directed DNA polymerase from mobile element jockey [Trichonephila clavipes]|nr:RNA-directed DNA polymerase from mobile element jockey [Trichonephila clavipes]
MHLPLIRTGISVKAGSSFVPPAVASPPFLRSSILALVTSLQFRPRSAVLFLQPPPAGGMISDIGLSFHPFSAILDPLIANYRLHKDDRNNFPRSRIDGGTSVYCKNNYDHNRVPLPTLQYMDAAAIEIKFNNFPPIRIVSAYARNTPENNRKFPDKDFLKILNSGQNIIIAGDLNATHRTGSNIAFGYALRKIVNNKSNVRIVAPHTPTHINASSRPGRRDSIIDLAVLKNIPFNHDIRVIDDLESDHLPVILTLYTDSALIKIPDQLSTIWENFKFLLNNKPLPVPPFSSNDDLEIAIRRLGENISEALIEASK